MEEKIKIIKDACIRSNPSILDLKFGCEVSIYFPPFGEHYEGAEYSPSKHSTATFIEHGEPMSFLNDIRGHMYDIYDTDFKNGAKEYIDEEDGSGLKSNRIDLTFRGEDPNWRILSEHLNK